MVGMRDRLRCPDCDKVGTWKPHGSRIFDSTDTRQVRRWLCKWCGYYYGPEGVCRAGLVSERGWVLDYDLHESDLPRDRVRGVDPWRG